MVNEVIFDKEDEAIVLQSRDYWLYLQTLSPAERLNATNWSDIRQRLDGKWGYFCFNNADYQGFNVVEYDEANYVVYD
jgi:hypothetical protein